MRAALLACLFAIGCGTGDFKAGCDAAASCVDDGYGAIIHCSTDESDFCCICDGEFFLCGRYNKCPSLPDLSSMSNDLVSPVDGGIID